MRRPTIGVLPTAGYGAAILLLVFMALLVRSYLRQLQTVGDAVRHTNDVIERLNNTTTSLLDVRQAGRAFATTRNPAYQQQFEEDLRAVQEGYIRAHALTGDNPVQAERALRLVTLAQQVAANARSELVAGLKRRDSLERGVRPPPLDRAHRHVQDEQRENIRRMTALTREMMTEENRLLNLRRSNARATLRRTTTSVLLALALALGLVVLSTWATVASMLGRRHAQQEQDRLQQIVDLQAAREVNMRFQEHIMGVLGHDLRNPLTAILMGANALQKAGSEPNIVGRILSSAERMRRMIGQLLDFARSRNGGIPLDAHPFDVVAVVRRVLDELEMANPARTLRLTVDGDTEGVFDPDRLEQVISNLVGNAIRYGAGEISVAVAGDTDNLRIAVHNDGAPIPADLMPAIFDPFRRGKGGGSSSLGLGLFITREIVQAHGGSIAAVSTVGGGTTFSVVLPRDPDASPSAIH